MSELIASAEQALPSETTLVPLYQELWQSERSVRATHEALDGHSLEDTIEELAATYDVRRRGPDTLAEGQLAAIGKQVLTAFFDKNVAQHVYEVSLAQQRETQQAIYDVFTGLAGKTVMIEAVGDKEPIQYLTFSDRTREYEHKRWLSRAKAIVPGPPPLELIKSNSRRLEFKPAERRRRYGHPGIYILQLIDQYDGSPTVSLRAES